MSIDAPGLAAPLRVLLLIVVAILPAAAASETRCPDVSLQTRNSLALGTVRTLPDMRGFLELHPRHGISVSNDGVVHQGPSGSAVLQITGPPSKRITLELAIQQTSKHQTSRLHLVELIVQGGGTTRRLDADGETLTVRLPDNAGSDGLARMRLEVGAVAAFRHHRNPQQARYRLTATCVSVRS